MMLVLIANPIVKGNPSDGNPKENGDEVHDDVHQSFLLLRRTESVRNQNDCRVKEVAHEHTRSDDFHIGILFLVEIPGAAHSEELTPVAGAIQDEDYDVENHFNHFDYNCGNCRHICHFARAVRTSESIRKPLQTPLKAFFNKWEGCCRKAKLRFM
uniref:Uncharacterized protein n=1 Tax=Cacopsylla melanoneura TaxID=428564 RepID=A0A8D8SBW2_9HEMI